MANLVAVGIKRKDAEVASHGFSMLLDPKRIKLEDEAEIPETMDEEEPLADVDADADAAPAAVQAQAAVSMPSPSPLQPAQGHDEAAVLRGSTAGTGSGSGSSEPALAAEQAAPMDVEEDIRQPQPQPGQHPRFWSGLF